MLAFVLMFAYVGNRLAVVDFAARHSCFGALLSSYLRSVMVFRIQERVSTLF